MRKNDAGKAAALYASEYHKARRELQQARAAINAFVEYGCTPRTIQEHSEAIERAKGG